MAAHWMVEGGLKPTGSVPSVLLPVALENAVSLPSEQLIRPTCPYLYTVLVDDTPDRVKVTEALCSSLSSAMAPVTVAALVPIGVLPIIPFFKSV